MTLSQAFRFDGSRVLVVGGASGMGAAAAAVLHDAGADVLVMDRVPITLDSVTPIHVDLAQRSTIDVALKQCGEPINAVLICSGVADGTANIELINFVAPRYLIDQMMRREQLPAGSAIALISSAAGLGWESNLDTLRPLLFNHDWDESAEWLRGHAMANYFFTKQAVCAYVATEAFTLLKKGIRINALCPGPTDTPLARANAEQWFAMGTDYRADTGTELLTPLQQAYPLAFLCSAAASAITGQTVISDGGYLTSGLCGSYPSATGIAEILCGRTHVDALTNTENSNENA